MSWNPRFLSSLSIPQVTLHVSVWVEIADKFGERDFYKSRSTWACELKFCIGFGGVCNASHAPRERVSWNINNLITFNRVFVTLHVSVWVEINCSGDCILSILVTLHVSVWVEIEEFYSYKHLSMSRSTWACELKLRCSNGTWTYSSHAPRERVSWNWDVLMALEHTRVTLHVSVWVEIEMF